MKNHNYFKNTFCFAILFPILSFTLPNPTFHKKTLKVSGNIHECIIADMDGNHEKDILLSLTDSNQIRKIVIYFQDNGQIGNKPETINIQHNSIAFDVADLNADQKNEILILRTHDFQIWSYQNKQFIKKLISFKATTPVIQLGNLKILPMWRMIYRPDSLMYPSILIPAIEGWDHFIWHKNAYVLKEHLFIPPQVHNNTKMQITLRPVRMEMHDFNADGFLDLLGIDDYLHVFFNHDPPEEEFEKYTLPLLKYPLKQNRIMLTEVESVRQPFQSYYLSDLNQDNAVDLIISHAVWGAFTHAISHLQIYYNRRGRLPSIPDQVITASNLSGEFFIRDLNQDGLLDIAVVYQSIGLMQGMRLLFTRKTQIGFDIYLMQPDGLYPNQPNNTLRFSRQPKITDLINYRMNASFSGDFNGDQIVDCLVSTDIDKYMIFFGDKNSEFDEKNHLVLPLERTQEYRICDLNNDSISDFVGFYSDFSEASHLTILISENSHNE